MVIRIANRRAFCAFLRISTSGFGGSVPPRDDRARARERASAIAAAAARHSVREGGEGVGAGGRGEGFGSEVSTVRAAIGFGAARGGRERRGVGKKGGKGRGRCWRERGRAPAGDSPSLARTQLRYVGARERNRHRW